jgi:hypothetical protein
MSVEELLAHCRTSLAASKVHEIELRDPCRRVPWARSCIACCAMRYRRRRPRSFGNRLGVVMSWAVTRGPAGVEAGPPNEAARPRILRPSNEETCGACPRGVGGPKAADIANEKGARTAKSRPDSSFSTACESARALKEAAHNPPRSFLGLSIRIPYRAKGSSDGRAPTLSPRSPRATGRRTGWIARLWSLSSLQGWWAGQ